MDVEKAIQFLTDNAAAHDARLRAIGNNLLTLTIVVKSLADTVVEHQKAMDEMRKEQRQRDPDIDGRIAKLVSAIGARASKRPQGPPR